VEDLQDLIRRRDKVKAEVERLKGRSEQAISALKEVEDECRSKKINPDNIQETIDQLQQRYNVQYKELEDMIKSAEEALKPYQETVP
jgi:DNA-binding ferritin-like protein